MIIVFTETNISGACFIKNFDRFLRGSISAFIIFPILFNTCNSEPRTTKSIDYLDSIKLNSNSSKLNSHAADTNIHHKSRLYHRNSSTKNNFKSNKTSQKHSDVMIKQNNNSYVMLSPINSSHFHNLIDLLRQHSREREVNDDIQNSPDESAHPRSQEDTLDPLKPEDNNSDPYFDMLYDLALDINPVYSEKLDKSTCSTLNLSDSHASLLPKYDENIKNKP